MNEIVTTTTANKPPIVVLRERLEQRKNEIKNALPSDIQPDVFIRALMTSAQINPDIQACSWQSLWTACLRACRDGLLPDGVEGAIVPFKGTATWIPMYAGLLRRFRKSGQFKWVTAGIVRQGEVFEHWITNTGEHFRHVPGDDNQLAPITKIYALATTKDGGEFVAVLSIAEANKIKNMSRATREDSPWKQWPEEMYKKTAIRRLSKVLPSARDIVGEEDLPEVPLERIAAPEGQRFGSTEALQSPTDARPATAPDAGDDPQESPEGEPGVDSYSEPPAATSSTDVAVTDAYERGKDAKARGHQARALPPEYRETTRTREALAWQAGHAGGPLPTFPQE
jgi:recombination protein RecT